MIAAYAGATAYAQPHVRGDRLSLTSFFELAKSGRVNEARILDVDSFVVGTYARTDATAARYSIVFLKESRTPLVELLIQSGVPTYVNQQNSKRIVDSASILLPTLIMAVLFLYLILSYKRGSGFFGASGARRARGDDVRVTFGDVAGQSEAVAELTEIRDFLANPARFAAMGAVAPKGVLLTGPPGCGKTLLARAVAGEADAAFYSISGSDFVELFVGVGAARVRDLFREARENAPAIVFIDELDSLGSRRSSTGSHGDSEREQTVNQILVELDGFETGAGVIVMGATNRPDLLDTALVRPGRFDRQVIVTLPDRSGRAAILSMHGQGKPMDADVDFGAVAGMTAGFSGADLANLLNEAALLAARRDLHGISSALVEEAVDRTLLGVVSRGTVLSEGERRTVAWHEAGHAVVALMLGGPEGAPRKVTVVPRGGVLGRCVFAESHDRMVEGRAYLQDQLAVGLAGWVTEETVLGEPSSAAASDLRRVAQIARRMVVELGMSRELGPLAVLDDADGPNGSEPSEDLRRFVDGQVRAMVNDARNRAGAVLASTRASVDRVAAALLERETVTIAELVALTDAAPFSASGATSGDLNSVRVATPPQH